MPTFKKFDLALRCEKKHAADTSFGVDFLSSSILRAELDGCNMVLDRPIPLYIQIGKKLFKIKKMLNDKYL